jgi:mono/diheme cytochrome c family protein
MVFFSAVIASSQEGDPKLGRRVYSQYCVPCHGQYGKGDGTRAYSEAFDPMPRNHTNGEYMNKRPQDELFGVIKNGGFSKNFSHIMPPWKTILKDDEVTNVLEYVRSLAVPPYSHNKAR